MTRISELPGLAALPAVRLIDHTDRIRAAVRADVPSLSLGAALHGLGRAHLVTPAMRTWALILGEVGPPRLPGGALLDPDGGAGLEMVPVTDAGATEHDRVCQCSHWSNHASTLWFGEAETALHAAVARDGQALFDGFGRVSVGLHMSPDDRMSFLASLASSACGTFAESGLDRRHDALLHLLGTYAAGPAMWSAAGYAYRLCAAVMTCCESGPELAEAVMGPEIDALAGASSLTIAAACGLTAKVYGDLLDDDPAAEFELGDERYMIRPHNRSDGSGSSGQQAEAARLGMRIAIACRRGSGRPGVGMPPDIQAMPNSRIALAAYGLCNLLAVRVRELWGP